MADEEEITEETTDEEIQKAGVLFTPEGIIMIGAAIILDAAGIALTVLDFVGFGTPEIVNWISDGIGLVFFGPWLMLRSALNSETTDAGELGGEVLQRRGAIKDATQKTKETIKAAEEAAKKAAEEAAKKTAETATKEATKGATKATKGTGRGLRFAISILGEVTPLIGALPFWTWSVYSELKNS